MNPAIFGSIASAAVLLMALTIAPVAAAPSATDKETNKLLSELKQATAKYHNPANAMADGYMSTDECVPQMGLHYVNPALASDLSVDELTPEVLLYAPSGSGVKLVGVEYFMVALANTPEGPQPWFGEEAPPDGWFTSNPVLFVDQTLEGPMPGHEEGMPWHYDLHVWVWKGNPDGVFSTWHQGVSCSE